ncbi:unnamed protein product [Vitrella brassicaformis CCMP3155]|uniref:Uncharacterized protein n=2 Tax=Vitrella brassicaformis TaxID=1169539 RepID=A0A0G4G1H8_VITBC|nr:unnamed protein product [Vitrella brassicaformis CCMP3155]|eukprot:CEM21873.1 unnamed protein product [Vitrella brassicaformis CCMP3155]
MSLKFTSDFAMRVVTTASLAQNAAWDERDNTATPSCPRIRTANSIWIEKGTDIPQTSLIGIGLHPLIFCRLPTMLLWLVAFHSAASLHKSAFLAPQLQRPVGFLRRHRPRASTRRFALNYTRVYTQEPSPEQIEIANPFKVWDLARGRYFALCDLDIDATENATHAKAMAAAEQQVAAATLDLTQRLRGNDTLCWHLVSVYWAKIGDCYRGNKYSLEQLKQNPHDDDASTVATVLNIMAVLFEARRNFILSILADRQHEIDPSGLTTIEMLNQAERELEQGAADTKKKPQSIADDAQDPFSHMRSFWDKQSQYHAWLKIFYSYTDSPNATMDVLVKEKEMAQEVAAMATAAEFDDRVNNVKQLRARTTLEVLMQRAGQDLPVTRGIGGRASAPSQEVFDQLNRIKTVAEEQPGDPHQGVVQGLGKVQEKEADKRIIERVEGKKEDGGGIEVQGIE